MQFSEANSGRVFIIRLEDGEVLHHRIEQFARDHKIHAALLICLGGADSGSNLITGPQKARMNPITPNTVVLNEVHEVTGTGTIFPDDKGEPVLHMHLACGRKRHTYTGCIRRGVKVWHVMEIVLYEIVNCQSTRTFDPDSGFELLKP